MSQSVYYKIQILCLGSTKMCLVMTRHILVGHWAVRGKKKKEGVLFYCLQ
jgi:hypothetical protein